MLKQITPKDVKVRLDAGDPLTLIDVREGWEVRHSHIEGAIHIPMYDIPDALDRIPRDNPVVVVCHHGNRSAQVVMWLGMQGFENALNMVGGIERWSAEVDPTVPRY
jgi:rhodanese-related sulfurtransferase